MALSCICGCGDEQETITALAVTGGAPPTVPTRVHGSWFFSVDVARQVIVTAATQPNTPAMHGNVDWNGQPLNAVVNQNQLQIPCTNAGGPITITASLDNSKSVDLYFVQIQTLVCENGEYIGNFHDGPAWKFYAGAAAAEITATENLDWYRYRNEFVWAWNTGNPGDSNRRRRVPVAAVGDIQVTATLYTHALSIYVRVCQVPILQVNQLTFAGGHDVDCDTLGNFDNIWEQGRNNPAAPVNPVAAMPNSPLCYTRNTPIRITARFNVTTAPTMQERVTIRGTANFNGTRLRWEQRDVVVNPTDATVTTNPMDSDRNIPNRVGYYHNLAITWEVIGPDGVTRNAGQTQHEIYVTLGAPNGTPAYWTLLDISCRAAQGATSENALVTQGYAAFQNKTGDGNGFHRLRDNQELTYYLNGVNTPSVNVFTTHDILNRVDGTGRCGGWARFFVDMCKAHGITTAQVIGVEPKVNGMLLLVENCHFGVGTLQAPYTHQGNVECLKQNGVEGQGKTNPQFIFGDHALVEHGGRIYDPSYGTGPFANLKTWEDAGIAGLGDPNGGFNAFNQGGTPQAITVRCGRGYIEHTMQAAQTLAAVARLYGVASANALYNHAYNHALQALRATIAGIQQNDPVIIPRDISNVAILKRMP